MHRRAFMQFCAGVFSLGALPRSRGDDAPGIWGKEILAQPFQKNPFREIRIPEWVEETLGVGYTLSNQSTEQRKRAVDAGVTISECGFVDPFYPYYESKLLAKRSPHVPLEKIHAEVAEYKRLGIRILGVYPPSLQGEVYEKHPEWRRIPTDTRETPQVDMQKYPHGGMLCLLGPYGDFFIEVLAEILTLFPDVDAFSFDGLHYAGVCYCPSCREAYRADFKAEIPTVNMDDPAFRRYQHWADRRMEDLVQRMQIRLKGIRSTVALVTWTTNAGRFGHFLDVPRNMPARLNLLLDAPDQEFWMDETNRGATIVPAFGAAYMWAVTNHRVGFSEPYLMSRGNPYGKDSFPGHEIRRRMLLVMTHGARPSIAVGQPPHLQQVVYDGIAEVKQHGPWLHHVSPEPWAALVMSDNTRAFYGRQAGQIESRYLSHVLGYYRALLESHLPFTVICDWNLTDDELSKYKVLILPNTACLDETQLAAIRRFVERGGGLVATEDTSLCNEFGDVKESLGLADLLGVQHLGLAESGASTETLDVNFARNLPADYWDKRKGVWDFQRQGESFLQSPKLVELIGTDRVTFKGPAVEVKPTTGQVLATLEPRAESSGHSLPAVVSNIHGKGRVVYFPAGIDAAYYLTPYPYERVMLRQAVEFVAPNPAPIEVDAPMCVHAVAMRQNKNGQRLVIHFFNDVNTTAFHGMPADDVPLREESLPIAGAKLRLYGYSVKQVRQEPAGTVLQTLAFANNAIEIVVPTFDVHVMIVVELV